MITEKDIITIRTYALQNACKYGKVPQGKAVLGKVMGACPHLRRFSKNLAPILGEIINDISKKNINEWEQELKEIAPELFEVIGVKKEVQKGLKPLSVKDGDMIVLRFAPNPNGPATLGSARGIIVNSEYAKIYNGKFIIRFDDTDPNIKRPMLEAYNWYLEDCEWLDAKPNKTIIASDRLDIYYNYAEKLIQKGHAYICFCKGDEFKKFKDNKESCPHRIQNSDWNLMHWKKMLEGKYEEKEAILRIKTDITNKDPALRDFGAFRIVKTSHPRNEVDLKYVVWPLLDFESAIEDYELGISHIIRGKDLMDSEKRQKYIYEYFGWKYPKTIYWGRIKIHEFGKFSTSELKKLIESGEYSGWDDPRVPTIRSIRKRGISPLALRKFMIELGVGSTDISISLDTLYAENRKIIDAKANRYFFVWNPIELEVLGDMPRIANPTIHPTEDKGYREIAVEDNIYLCKDDVDKLNIGEEVRLKDLCNIKIISKSPLKAEYTDNSIGINKMRIIHWVPINGISIKVLAPHGEFNGIGEKGILNELDSVVQFERFGYVRIDSIKEEKEVIAYYAHK